MSRDCSIDTLMGYGLEGRDSIPGTGQIFFSTAFMPNVNLTQHLYAMGTVKSPAVKQPEREAGQSPPPNTEVKTGSYTTPPMPLEDEVFNELGIWII
jgi:hypothetical protein